MPKITEYTNTQDVSGAPFEGAAMSMLRLGRMQESAIQETGAAAQHVVGQIEQHRAQTETTQLATQMAQANSQFFDDWEQTKANSDPNDPNVAKNFLDEHVRPTLEKFRDGLITNQGKDMMSKMVANMTTEWHERTASDQARMSADAAANSWDQFQSSATKAAYLDPTAGDRQIDLMRTAMEHTGAAHLVPKNKIDDAVRKASSQVQMAQGLGMIDKNPEAALKALQDPTNFKTLSGDQTAELTDRAQSKMRTIQDKTLGAARVSFEDSADRMLNTGSWGPTQYTREQAVALGGDNPGERARMGQLWDVANAAGKENEKANSQDMTLQDQARYAQDVVAAAAKAPDYHAGAAAAKAAVEAYSRRQAAFNKDPISYVSQKSPYVQEAWDKFSQAPSPERYQEALTMSVAEQKRMDPTAAPRIVPAQIADQIKTQLGQMDTEGGPERAAQTLGQWQNTIGPTYWPQAVAELRGKKVLSAEQAVAANLSADGKVPMSSDLLQAAAMKDTDLSPSPTHTKAVQGSVASALSKLSASVAYEVGGAAYMRDQVDAMTKLALFEQKKNPNVNVTDLARSALQDNYQFRGTMRIPNGVNADIVARGARQIQSNLTKDQVSGITDVSSVREFGHWSTMSGDTGLRLVDDKGNRVFEKRDDGEFPIQRTWAELQSQNVLPGTRVTATGGSGTTGALEQPQSIQSMVRTTAKAAGVPEHIALGLVEQESRFDPGAVSPTGARGLGQLTSGFIKDYGNGLDPTTPEGNAAISMRGLASLKDRYGTWEAALKHYGDPNQTTYSQEVMRRAEKYK